jgi:hypothetical protein
VSVYTDKINPSATPTEYFRRYIPTVSPTEYTVRLEYMQQHGDVKRFYRWKWPRDSNWDSRTVTWRVTDGSTDEITDGSNPSVMPSEKTIICTHLPTLSSSVSPSSSFPSHLSPPKLQPNTHLKLSTILNTSTQVSYILYVVTISVSFRCYHFFVSKSILFSFNI